MHNQTCTLLQQTKKGLQADSINLWWHPAPVVLGKMSAQKMTVRPRTSEGAGASTSYSSMSSRNIEHTQV